MLCEVGLNSTCKTNVDSTNLATRLVEDLRMVDKVSLHMAFVPSESYKQGFGPKSGDKSFPIHSALRLRVQRKSTCCAPCFTSINLHDYTVVAKTRTNGINKVPEMSHCACLVCIHKIASNLLKYV